MQVRYRKFFWIEDLIRLVEECASCEVYALLKRQTKVRHRKGLLQPHVRGGRGAGIAHRLGQNDNFIWYSVESENFESIHNHSAYAYIESKKISPPKFCPPAAFGGFRVRKSEGDRSMVFCAIFPSGG